MGSAPSLGREPQAPGHSPRILFPTAFTIDILRFEVYFSCFVWVLRRDSISAHVWYGLRTNLFYSSKNKCHFLVVFALTRGDTYGIFLLPLRYFRCGHFDFASHRLRPVRVWANENVFLIACLNKCFYSYKFAVFVVPFF